MIEVPKLEQIGDYSSEFSGICQLHVLDEHGQKPGQDYAFQFNLQSINWKPEAPEEQQSRLSQGLLWLLGTPTKPETTVDLKNNLVCCGGDGYAITFAETPPIGCLSTKVCTKRHTQDDAYDFAHLERIAPRDWQSLVENATVQTISTAPGQQFMMFPWIAHYNHSPLNNLGAGEPAQLPVYLIARKLILNPCRNNGSQGNQWYLVGVLLGIVPELLDQISQSFATLNWHSFQPCDQSASVEGLPERWQKVVHTIKDAAQAPRAKKKRKS